jgi:hypothetical protein
MTPTFVKNARNIGDAALEALKALPAAGAANYTDGIDLGQTLGGTIEGVEVVVQMEATDTLVDTKAVTFTLKDSADNITFAAIPGLAALTVTGTSGNVSAAYELRLRLPTATKRYIRLDASVPADAGTVTDANYQLTVLV